MINRLKADHFTIVNKEGQGVIFKTANPDLNMLTFTFLNNTGKPVLLTSSSFFNFSFESILNSDVVANLKITLPPGWRSIYLKGDSTKPDSWSVAPIQTMTINDQGTVSFIIQNITCDRVTAGNFEIMYGNVIDYKDSVFPITKYLSIQNPWVDKTVLSDAIKTVKNLPDQAARPKLASMRALPPAQLDQVNIAYIDMGQGDCTIISLPNNRVVVVDCGSSAALDEDIFEKAQQLLASWAKGKSIDVILTHPDKDHYNKIRRLVSEVKPSIMVGNLYFSRSQSNNSPLGYYKEDALGKNLRLLGLPRLVEVTINTNKNSQTIWINFFDYKDGISTPLTSNNLVLYQGTTTKGKAWSLSIIAGNVQTTSKTPSIQSNCVSLITLVTLGSEKLLLMGDATSETMGYLYDKQSQEINNVSIFQVPHHGSDGSMPTDVFKNLVDPESLRISVGLLSNGYKLPRYTVIDSWLKCKSILSATEVATDYWKLPTDFPQYRTTSDLETILSNKWKGYDYDQNKERTFFWLLDPKDAGPTKSGTGFYGFTNDRYFLFRESIKKDIWETGIEGTSISDGFKEIFIR